MVQRSDDELTAGLQSPTEAAAQRAKPIFDRLVGEMRAGRQIPTAQTPAPAEVLPHALAPGGGRRYDVAVSMVVGLGDRLPASFPTSDSNDPLAPPDMFTPTPAHIPMSMPENDDPTQVSPADSRLEPTPEGERPPEITRTQVRRPPAGAPTIRQSVKRPPQAPEPTPEMIKRTAESAMLRTESDGSMAFDIEFNDDMFANLACTISVNNGRATAVFRVSDDNTRRLLEGEIGRLRSGLENRGLKVEEVRVLAYGA